MLAAGGSVCPVVVWGLWDARWMPVPTSRELAIYTLAQQQPVTYRWSTQSDRLALLSVEHQLDVDMVTDQEFAGRRRDLFAPDQSIDLFLNSWHVVGPDLGVMFSMRYEGGDPGSPFVEASALSRPVTDPMDIAAVAAVARERFGALRPAYLRWWSPEPVGAITATSQDKRFLAAPLSQLVDQPVSDQLTLEPTADVAHYDEAADAYASLDRLHPAHHRQARIEARADLDDLAWTGLLFDVFVHDRWSGYVAAEAGHKLGLAGFTVAELILTEPARGHGLGRFLTTMLARALLNHGRPEQILIGTIHHHNTGAVRAARQAGRHDIGGWVTYPLAA